MNPELQNALRIVEEGKQMAKVKNYELVNSFRTKMNLLISKTPTGELREELSELNIIYETILENQNTLSKL